MNQFKALDSNVEVLGQSIMSVVNSLGDAATPILKKHGIHPLESDGWYNQQDWLNAFADFEKSNFMNLVAIGMKVPDNAVWPDHVRTVHDALESINIAYGMNHRGGEIGGYRYERTGDRSGTMICENPYPSDFDYGIMYRILQKFRGTESDTILVRLDDSKPTRKKGGDSCTFLMEW